MLIRGARPVPPPSGPAGRALLCLYWALALWLAWLVFDDAAFGLIDDHVFYNHSLLGSYWRLFWGNELARFCPLNGREFLILREAGVMSAPLFLGIQSLKLLACAGLALGVLRRYGAPLGAACAAGALMLTTPAFLVAASRLFIPELTSLTFFLAALYFMPGPDDRRAGWRFWAALAAGNLALYYKEPGFLALGALASMLVIGAGFGRGGVQGRFARALLVSAGLYVAAYYFLAYRYKGAQTYAAGRQLPLSDILAYYAQNDVLLLGGLAVLCALAPRLWRGRDGERAAVACLAGALVYVGVFFVLRITSPWYLLPAWAFMLPALGTALGLAAGARGRAWKAAAAAAVCVAGASSVAGGIYHLKFNKAAEGGMERFFDFLASRPHAEGSPPEVILVPRIDPDSEIAHGLRVMLSYKWLAKRYEYRFGVNEDLTSFLASHKGLVMLTPFTLVSDNELKGLAQCYRTLHASPEGVRDYSLAGVTPRIVKSAAPASELLANSLRLRGNFALLEGDVTGCNRPFDWSRLRFEADAVGLKVCPLSKASFKIRVTNDSGEEFVRERAVLGNTVKIVMASARQGEELRFVGQKDLPERIAPGETVTIEASFTPHGFTPAALGGYLGFLNSEGGIHLAWDGQIFAGHFKPSPGACLE